MQLDSESQTKLKRLKKKPQEKNENLRKFLSGVPSQSDNLYICYCICVIKSVLLYLCYCEKLNLTGMSESRSQHIETPIRSPMHLTN